MKKIVIVGILFVGIVFVSFFFIYKENKKQAPVEIKKVVVHSPRQGEKIQSPYMINGKARGIWFFEASFPIVLKDEKGTEIARTIARAEGNWMTEEFVPFSAELVFPLQKEGLSGILEFKKDNPSGLKEYDDMVGIPIRF